MFTLSFSGFILLVLTFFVAGIIDAAAGATASVIRYSKNKKIYWQTALVAGVLSLAGSYFGSKLNIMIPEKYLQYIMIVILPVNCNSIATEVYHFFRLNVPHLS